MNRKYFLGLPPVSLNFISGGLFVFIVCLVRVRHWTTKWSLSKKNWLVL
jgi:hypothetical protein